MTPLTIYVDARIANLEVLDIYADAVIKLNLSKCCFLALQPTT